jgi:hypothetical protein
MNDAPTPRTNDQSVRYYDDATGRRIEYVAARFARQLERELTQREHQLAEARELTKRQGEIIAEMMTPAEQRLSELEIALAIERALADRLASCLKPFAKWHGVGNALEAWKEARK